MKISRRYRWAIRVAALGIYFVAMTFTGCVDRLILFPSTDSVALAGTSRRLVPWKGGQLEVWTASARRSDGVEPRAYVLAFIGNADRAEFAVLRAAGQWEGHPVEVWAVNYPGYGGSSGPARLASIPPSALTAYDALAQRAGGKPIFVSGMSLGTAAALHVAARRPVAGLVLQNPPPLRQMILRRFGWWNLWLIAGPVALHVPADLDSIANARQASAPAAFLLAGADEVVPPKYQQWVVDAYAGEKRLVRLPGSNHNDMPEGQAEADARAAIDWLWSRGVADPASRRDSP